jgi:hypothetical protein
MAPLAMLQQNGVQALLGGDLVMLFACLALAAAVLIFIFYIEPDASDSAPHRSRLDQLLERRDTIYDNLRDLKFEHRSGKFSENDYEQTKQALETEAAIVLAEIEKVTGAPSRPVRRDAPAPVTPEKSAT